ncbi:MAG: tetratricopeptide repeat protein, partial [Acidobacteria bacterium]|nr:tetratricopeptide repeat protein [Acidobacteriota bacterium]
AFYINLPHRDYIAIGPSASGDDRRSAVHEYVHLLNRHGDTELPVWMNEGTAELYSNIEPVRKKIRVGTPIPSHAFLLQSQWLPLEDVIHADHKSPLYNRRQHVGPFYGLCWALVHMLALDPRYSPKFSQVYTAFGVGKTSREALEQTYGKPLKAIEADLKSYTRGNAVLVVNFDIQFERVDKVTPRRATAYDWGIAMADLKAAARKNDEALKALQALVKEDPSRPESHESIAFVHMMDRSDKAADAFRAARKAGSEHPQLAYWAPSMLRSYQESMPELRRLVEKYPDYVEARLRLASMQVNTREYENAFATLKAIRKVNRKQAMEYFPSMIQSAWMLKNLDEARAAASQFVKTARTERDKERATEMFAFAMKDPPEEKAELAKVESTLPGAVNTTVAFEPDTTELILPDDSGLEVVKENGKFSHLRQIESTYLEGTLINLECAAPSAILHVRDASGQITRLIILDPGDVKLVNSSTGTGNLDCGEQSKKVKVGFLPRVNEAQKTTGNLRSIEYLP